MSLHFSCKARWLVHFSSISNSRCFYFWCVRRVPCGGWAKIEASLALLGALSTFFLFFFFFLRNTTGMRGPSCRLQLQFLFFFSFCFVLCWAEPGVLRLALQPHLTCRFMTVDSTYQSILRMAFKGPANLSNRRARNVCAGGCRIEMLRSGIHGDSFVSAGWTA